MPTYIFTATKYYPGAMVKCARMEAQLRVHLADSACEQQLIEVQATVSFFLFFLMSLSYKRGKKLLYNM